jgi:hypothetical protein
VSYDYSEATDYSAKSTLTFVYGTTPTYQIDGQAVTVVTDLGGAGGLRATLQEFIADDADGQTDVTDLQKRTQGGIVVTRSSDLSTVVIGPRPGVPWVRAVALHDLLVALGY